MTDSESGAKAGRLTGTTVLTSSRGADCHFYNNSLEKV